MRTKIQSISAIMVAILLVLFLGEYAVADGSKVGKKEGQVTKMELRISNDGKAMVDQNGKEVARFAEDMRVQMMTKKNGQKLQGCFVCRYECIAYENGMCVRWNRTCDWDFDCK